MRWRTTSTGLGTAGNSTVDLCDHSPVSYVADDLDELVVSYEAG
ncbi:hypothetical protein [Streptomyces sp. NPDC017940]